MFGRGERGMLDSSMGRIADFGTMSLPILRSLGSVVVSLDVVWRSKGDGDRGREAVFVYSRRGDRDQRFRVELCPTSHAAPKSILPSIPNTSQRLTVPLNVVLICLILFEERECLRNY